MRRLERSNHEDAVRRASDWLVRLDDGHDPSAAQHDLVPGLPVDFGRTVTRWIKRLTALVNELVLKNARHGSERNA